jgi:hypothetical protein
VFVLRKIGDLVHLGSNFAVNGPVPYDVLENKTDSDPTWHIFQEKLRIFYFTEGNFNDLMLIQASTSLSF